jgi:hypothetical protein
MDINNRIQVSAAKVNVTHRGKTSEEKCILTNLLSTHLIAHFPPKAFVTGVFCDNVSLVQRLRPVNVAFALLIFILVSFGLNLQF